MSGLNFDALSGPSAADRETHPRDIFAALPSKSSRFEYLRDVQREVFDGWHLRRTERDLVVKMNTGNGKTLVGLLMLKSCLNEGVYPAAYLTPSVFLADEVTDTAMALGLRVARDPRDPDVAAGKAILVATVQTLFNGRSKFGVGSEGRKIRLGSVLIDDAHACLNVIEEQFEIKIPAEHAASQKIRRRFSSVLEAQDHAKFLAILDGERQPALLVPPWDWYDAQPEIMQILHSHKSDEPLEWTWPLVSGCLSQCRCVIDAAEVQIKPILPPVDVIPSFAQAKRRIYLTATLSDDSVVVTHFAADADSIRKSLTPSAADDIGDRMILAPQMIQPAWSDDDLKGYLSEISKVHNVVVIVPSKRRADWWSDIADQTLDAGKLQAGIKALRDGRIGLTVLIGKYDGVDLPDDACRVLVIDGVPEAYDGLARVEASALDDTHAMTGRQLQRTEQGMGRGIRSRDDHCVVLLLGGRLIRRLIEGDALAHFSPATRAQMQLANQVFDQLRDGTVDDIKTAISQFLTRHPGWVTASRNALNGVKYGTGSVSEAAVQSRRAFELAVQQRYPEAADAQQKAVNAVSQSPRERGWLMQQQAAFVHPTDAVRAQEIQTVALDHNSSLLRPKQGVAYVRLKGRAQEQAVSAATFLSGQYSNGTEAAAAINALLSDLIYDQDPNTVEPFEQAVYDLGDHLGLVTQRPERDFKRGSDNLWALNETNYFVIECKSAVTTDYIRKKDADQLAGSMNWFRAEYSHPATALPVLFHPVNRPNRDASLPAGTRIVTREDLESMKDSVRMWAMSLNDIDLSNPDEVGARLKLHKLSGQKIITTHSSVVAP